MSQFRNTFQRNTEQFRAASSTEMFFYCKLQNENAVMLGRQGGKAVRRISRKTKCLVYIF